MDVPGIVIHARHLDNDERSERRVAVAVRPHSDAGQRTQLREAVERVHPEARIRSYAEGVASFVTSTHLVVARYDSVPVQADDDHLQHSLFAG
jgi:hypothetical protein